ncbi:carbohydrate ABC transporter permease [Labrys wisconsinensis]|uniref:Maltose/maltodextrin transport system permease protein MalG n=1 Tax=Labrys wisconsinensis TaxID=425677 RepID=A0ABU0JIJ0_9HYPH|nr:multiple sugar transport system permease protein [Labrys wisconsinensis]
MKPSRLASIALHLAAVAFAAVILAPIAWMVLLSVSSTKDLTTLPFRWIPAELDLSRYAELIHYADNTRGKAFLLALRNTITVAAGTTAVALVCAVPAAWSFSRFRGRQSPLLGVVIAIYMMPATAIVVPLYRILSGAGLLNTPIGLILVDCTLVLPFAIWLMKSNFDAVPSEIEEAAFVDGAGVLKTLWLVTLPMVRPALATTALFAILNVWDEFLYAFIFTSDSRAQTLVVTIANLASGRESDYGLLATAGLLTALPPILIGIVLQRTLVSGLAQGGIKG